MSLSRGAWDDDKPSNITRSDLDGGRGGGGTRLPYLHVQDLAPRRKEEGEKKKKGQNSVYHTGVLGTLVLYQSPGTRSRDRSTRRRAEQRVAKWTLMARPAMPTGACYLLMVPRRTGFTSRVQGTWCKPFLLATAVTPYLQLRLYKQPCTLDRIK